MGNALSAIAAIAFMGLMFVLVFFVIPLYPVYHEQVNANIINSAYDNGYGLVATDDGKTFIISGNFALYSKISTCKSIVVDTHETIVRNGIYIDKLVSCNGVNTS